MWSTFHLLLRIPIYLFWLYIAFHFFILKPYMLYKTYKERDRKTFKNKLAWFCLIYPIIILVFLGMVYLTPEGYYPLYWFKERIFC